MRSARRGKEAHDAIYQACLLRFRPILMTTMAAHARRGAARPRPRAWAPNCGARSGITIIGGLIFSQMLTLYTTPVIYLFFDRLAPRMAAWRRNPLRAAAPAAADSRHESVRTVHPHGRSRRRC